MAKSRSNNYNNNSRLKAIGVAIEFTPEQVQEFSKCQSDPIYFIEHYMKIIHLDRGEEIIKLYPFQKKIINAVWKNRFVIAKIARQSGKTICLIGFILWLIVFHPNQKVAILAQGQKIAGKTMGQLKFAYENLPLWLQQGVKEWNKLSIELENNSKVVCGPTTVSTARGDSYNMVYLDEFAFIPQHIAEEFFASVFPTISSGKTTKMVVTSTPHGMNHYHKMWVDATKGRSGYIPIECHWSEIPGRDEKWVADIKKNLGKESLWFQEYECEFLGSEDTLISGSKLATLVYDDPIMSTKDGFQIFEDPIPNEVYAVTTDTSEAIGLDNHALIVTKITKMPYKVVATFKNNTLSPTIYPRFIDRVATRYNQAYLLCQLNDLGLSVATELKTEIGYENMMSVFQDGKHGQRLGEGFAAQGRIQYGVKMSCGVKRIGCSFLKDMIENNQFLVSDHEIISELSTFVAVNKSYEASEGHTDDLTSCLIVFAWMAHQPYFKELMNANIRKLVNKEALDRMDAELSPIGFIPSFADPDDIFLQEEYERDRQLLARESVNFFPVSNQEKHNSLGYSTEEIEDILAKWMAS